MLTDMEPTNLMKPLLNIAAAAACGAAAMYFLDPKAGRRRRAYVRDKAVEARHGVSEYASAGARRVAEQARGVAADLRAEWRNAGRGPGHEGGDANALDDARIVERIRAALALMASHPRDIEVGVEHGRPHRRRRAPPRARWRRRRQRRALGGGSFRAARAGCRRRLAAGRRHRLGAVTGRAGRRRRVSAGAAAGAGRRLRHGCAAAALAAHPAVIQMT
ncbi:hypothetical protein [Burkholderia glumae]|uniref:hypothetical protein n=1 Tax=Burkholderia glumae TaxID=337 RepID=UPI0020374C30|nr:hypothetical protein [Burkholderia glumae]MCM2552159.1 hypothetical protein [Burkholderia glumae]